MRYIAGLFTVLILSSFSLSAQSPKKYDAAEIHQLLKKLNTLGSVMYIAAHPDDENTSMIAYYANEKLFRTAYMAATRGDGGQNLIGPEIREELGIIRTQELLAARRTDGGRQFFSRANDFGYSKDPDETFNIWDRDKVLADFVWNIRKFRPDILITRFSLEPGVTHGHHTASAILANEAFDLAGDPAAFPDQLKFVKPWQPKRIFWNTSYWFYRRTGQEFDTTGLVAVDVGEYNRLLGKSYTEISALSRSMHKSQGFGATGARGTNVEYLKQWKGEEAQSDPFEGINTSWTRVGGGELVATHTENALLNFDPHNPSMVVPDLIKALKALDQIDDTFWRDEKRSELQEAIRACLGLYLEVKSDDFAAIPGDSVAISFEAINRSGIPVTLSALRFPELDKQPIALTQKLSYNAPFLWDEKIKVPDDMQYSQPYWLVDQGTLGMYAVGDQQLIGLPENKPAINMEATVLVDGYYLDFELPLVNKKNDPVDGEVYRPFVITPPVFANVNDKVYVMANGSPKYVSVTVIAGKPDLEGEVRLQLPDGWKSQPSSFDVSLDLLMEEANFEFLVTPPKMQDEGILTVEVLVDGKKYDKSLSTINYDHIPLQTLFPQASAKVVNVALEKRGQSIGYIMGAGDEIPASLEQIGYQVTMLADDDITAESLSQFDAVILGVRAYNTLPRLKFHQAKLMEYVKNGGTMIVQYNTSHRMTLDDIAPFPLHLSRDRVTVEEAEVRFLAPTHPILNFPNKISQSDFSGWVQERGLYFPDEWAEEFVPILSSNDPGETPKDGGLLVAKYGKGYYIYSGYSWFRELPAGVSGAYRLFTNMISIGQQPIDNND